MAYRAEIHRAAQKQVLSLSREARVEVAQAIDGLGREPRPFGCRKLRATALWRARVGRYRVVYTVDNEARLVTVVKVAARREDTYKGV
ncbi:MAG: type II toxin-antitoxin system RelE/ParE family toxin [Chloroflexota bacterium]